ncbi:WD40-repeat-containing domain protein [Suillus clintonianus]|uniref:WD40-repeat-containing domain protein n=1 Tax=Suillus clintonianus TaxID=1904413 RepID=UPI001B868BA4|nr:WD40-repeat-containing domain protein [Suillus clintonianus]KAG2147991.1 WD40-repeat-containing domain protein [Suillus clintonianus]
MSLLESPSFETIASAIKSTSHPDGSYVLALTSLGDYYVSSASAPSNAIHLFDKSSLQRVQTLKGHEIATTALRTVRGLGGSDRHMLLSAGKDGCVIGWDERSGAPSIKMTTSGRSRTVLSCDASHDGLTVAAGTDLQKEDAFILYWDPRKPAVPFRVHGSTHSDDITAVHFLKNSPSPTSGQILLSASTDGLVSTSNSAEDDEDEAVLNVGSWGCSISQAGWIRGSSTNRVWAASDMETFSCWSNELDMLQNCDIRHPSVHSYGRTWVTDYLITCHNTNRSDSNLAVFVGSNEGDVALLSSLDVADSSAPWTINSVWAKGHTGVVRSVLWDDNHEILVTGGEDSKINTWRCPISGYSSVDKSARDESAMDSMGSAIFKRERDDDMDISESEPDGKKIKR